jgi:lipopolysaccharide/colanic/teichoic acid biosynthesis glycosyltransferase
MLAIFLIQRIAYSTVVMFIGFSTIIVLCYISYFLDNRYRLVRYALVPLGETLEFENTRMIQFELLEQPKLQNKRFDGVIADLHSEQLTPEWEMFLAHCTLNRIPVYHIKQIWESLTGKVKIEQLPENKFGSLLPSSYYEKIKRIIDFIVALCLLCILFPFLLFIAILIKLEGKGQIFIIQERIGFRKKAFNLYKFRTVYTNKLGERIDVSKVGRAIKKYRIDELPQIFNVLIGDISFIGPRSELVELSEQYEKDIPFFSYRYAVRPGISGWTQIQSEKVDSMNTKLEYDLYYLKHFSLWLDILIVFKTLKSIFISNR